MPDVIAAPAAAATPNPADLAAVIQPAAAVVEPAATVVQPVVEDAAAKAAKATADAAAKATADAAAKTAADAAAKTAREAVEKELRPTVEKEQLTKLVDAAKKQAEKWTNDAKTDKEIGGEQFDASLVSAKSVLTAFGNEGFKSYLETTGLGNHPEMIRLLTKVAKAIGPDKLLSGGQGANQGGAKSIADVMYPNQAKKA